MHQNNYSGLQIESFSLRNFLQGAERHFASVKILREHHDPSVVIYSVELLLYTCVEMSLKLIYALGKIETEWEVLSKKTPQETHANIDNFLREGGHRVDVILLNIRCTGDSYVIPHLLSDLEINHVDNKYAGPFYEITYRSYKFPLNDSFSVRYPAYSGGTGVAITLQSPDAKLELVEALLSLCREMMSNFESRWKVE